MKSKAWPPVAKLAVGAVGICSAVLILSSLGKLGLEDSKSNTTPPSTEVIVMGDLSLSCVIMAGFTTLLKERRIRELGVFLRNVLPEQIEDGVIEISKANKSDPGGPFIFVSRIRVKNYVDQRTKLSARVGTGVIVDKMDFYWRGHPRPNQVYCCELFVNDTSAAYGCLQFRPRWMEKMLPKLGKLRLRSLAIPGTHQSGTWQHASDYDFVDLTIRETYRDCQEEDVYHQLLYGIRALDLRPKAERAGKCKYLWDVYPVSCRKEFLYTIVHWRDTDNDVWHILNQVNDFLNNFEKEVVIIDFHEFAEGFDLPYAYEGLEDLVTERLGRHVFRNGTVTPAEMTLEEVIKRGQRAIVTFQKNDYLRKKFLPGVQHLWADTDNVTELREYLKKEQKGRRGDRFFSAMAEITGRVFYIVTDWYDGVRGQAHDNNFEISSWYAEDKEMQRYANIIAMDYFASSDIVDVCIDINWERMADPELWNSRNNVF